MNVYVCLYLFSQQEDDHCFIIQDIEDQCREGLIMQNDDHLFLQSRYLLSARGSKERLKLDCQFENKYIQSTCFAREVTLLRICRSFCPEIFKLQGSSVTDQHQGRNRFQSECRPSKERWEDPNLVFPCVPVLCQHTLQRWIIYSFV